MVALPMPFRGVEGAFEDAGTWTQGMVLRYDEGSIAQRPERGFGHKNQSLMALANRLLREIPADGEARDGWRVNVASLSFPTVNKIILMSALVLGGAYVALMPRKANRNQVSSAIEYALLALLILMFSPLSFNYSFVWLLYPLTLALHLGLEASERSASRRVLIGSVVCSISLLGLSLVESRTAAGYGNSFFAAFVLLVALGWRLAIEPGADSPVQIGWNWLLRQLGKTVKIDRASAIPSPHLGKGLEHPESATTDGPAVHTWDL
jgi:hypothetical protein